jgi:hypothetical protein
MMCACETWPVVAVMPVTVGGQSEMGAFAEGAVALCPVCLVWHLYAETPEADARRAIELAGAVHHALEADPPDDALRCGCGAMLKVDPKVAPLGLPSALARRGWGTRRSGQLCCPACRARNEAQAAQSIA